MSVQVYSGKGGAGGVAFHREKFMVIPDRYKIQSTSLRFPV